MNVRSLILVFLLSFFKPLGSICGDPAAITQEELVRRTQELFDAVVPGNKEPWQKYFADDCIFADEKGRNLNKTQLVADISAPAERLFGHDQDREAQKCHSR